MRGYSSPDGERSYWATSGPLQRPCEKVLYSYITLFLWKFMSQNCLWKKWNNCTKEIIPSPLFMYNKFLGKEKNSRKYFPHRYRIQENSFLVKKKNLFSFKFIHINYNTCPTTDKIMFCCDRKGNSLNWLIGDRPINYFIGRCSEFSSPGFFNLNDTVRRCNILIIMRMRCDNSVLCLADSIDRMQTGELQTLKTIYWFPKYLF